MKGEDSKLKKDVKVRKKSPLLKESLVPYWFILPAVLLVVLFYGYPFIKSLYMSFMNYNLVMEHNIYFNNFENYKGIFDDPVFGKAAVNTLIWVFYSLIIQFILGFILALLLWKPFKGRNVYQSIVFIPWAVSGFLIGIMFRWMFNAQFGVINDLLLKLGLIQENIPFLSQPSTVMIGPIAGAIWYGIPFFAIMILAALQGIPNEIFEAAEMDGASKMTRFWKIIVPFIKPTLLVTVLLRAIWIFNSADIIYVMTNGGPANSSHTLATYLFQKAYTALDFGSASAIAVVIIIFLAIYTLIYLTVSKFEEAGDF
ncbi:MAG: sugar ABC transporter permease [Clostridia bacterium]|nr:sugar ABC transporter permease [Clostridia bacterium]